MSDIEVVGLGAMNVDQLYRVERILADGEGLVKESSLLPGGSAANTIYALARLGVKAGFVGTVGDDGEGEMLLRDFEAAGVDISQVRAKGGVKTGSVLCLSDSLSNRALYVSPGANNLLVAEDIDLEYINRTQVLHISSFAGEEQLGMQIDLVNKLSPQVKVSFSPGALYAARGLPALASLMRRAYILFVNRDEVEQLTGEDFMAGARVCLERGCNIVVVTLGEGMMLDEAKVIACYIADGKNEYTVESRQTVVGPMDTTGAGDAFVAGFILGLLKGKKLEECGTLGDIMASFSLAGIGAREKLPSLSELTARYYKLYHSSL